MSINDVLPMVVRFLVEKLVCAERESMCSVIDIYKCKKYKLIPGFGKLYEFWNNIYIFRLVENKYRISTCWPAIEEETPSFIPR